MMRMAAVGASPLAAEDELDPWWFVDMVALESWDTSLLTRTTDLLSLGKARLDDKEQMRMTLLIKQLLYDCFGHL